MAFSWTCPFCGRDTTITSSDTTSFEDRLHIDNSVGDHSIIGKFIVCPNEKCKKYTLDFWLGTTKRTYGGGYGFGEVLKHWQLVPPSRAQVFPSYVPKPVKDDYEEACLILNGSPKASATLARRCLQGMIRDFWKVKKPDNHKGLWTLKDEIEAIKDKVEPETWDAIDSVRKIGNIGAHMEEDINVIVDVEPVEAEKLIWLIEVLIKDWYVNKHQRQLRLKEITQTADEKGQTRKGVRKTEESTTSPTEGAENS
ncbi:MAG: DUF4145 domain-containing protein [Patescibacteria group bacterium]|nr:DUF4145 domain-containing protein [Patescibacteria group bacterium]